MARVGVVRGAYRAAAASEQAVRMRPEMAPSLLHLSYCRLYSRLAPSNISNPLFAFPAPTTACSASRTEGEIGGKSAEFQSYRSSPGSGKAGSRQWEGSIKKVEAKGFEYR